MGIKICPDCGGKVSESLNQCIHCGHIFEDGTNGTEKNNCKELLRFNERGSFVSVIIFTVAICELILPIVLAVSWINADISFTMFFLVLVIIFEIIIPIAMVNEIITVARANSNYGKAILYNEDKDVLIVPQGNSVVEINPSRVQTVKGTKPLTIFYENGSTIKMIKVGFCQNENLTKLQAVLKNSNLNNVDK